MYVSRVKIRNVGNEVTKFSYFLSSSRRSNVTTENGNSVIKRMVMSRQDLTKCNRILVKLGSAVLVREGVNHLALGRIASIVEQISELQMQGKQMILVTSGAVAFGRQKLSKEKVMSASFRESLMQEKNQKELFSSRASSAVGQCRLTSLYDTLFMEFGLRTAQILLSERDFADLDRRRHLRSTLNDLLKYNIIPIINTNDALDAGLENKNQTEQKTNFAKDNDSVAAVIAAELDADLLLVLSNVAGVFTHPPNFPHHQSKLLSTFYPNSPTCQPLFGEKSTVGTGGMKAKMESALGAFNQGVSVVIADGSADEVVLQVVAGKRVGTFFSRQNFNSKDNLENIAQKVRKTSRRLESLKASDRSDLIRSISSSLLRSQQRILDANKLDVDEAVKNGAKDTLISRLQLSESKLKALVSSLEQVSSTSCDLLGSIIKQTKLADDLWLKQIRVPIGVVLVIFEARPECLIQIASLAVSSGNGLLLKGGKEARNSNKILFQILSEVLAGKGLEDSMALLNTREDVDELLQMNSLIDLVLPRGSNELVRHIQSLAGSIPVLGHSDGVCHVYIDEDCDQNVALDIIKDSKCDYPAACNAMETLLIHASHVNGPFFQKIIQLLDSNKVDIHAGPRLHKLFLPATKEATSMHVEYGSLACTVEVVESVHDAIEHINTFGSSHTDAIVTRNDETASLFVDGVDSSCVFHNASTRFSDGYRFGLGAEVGISTMKVHARGPVGVEGLLSTKWILEGRGNVVSEFNSGKKTFLHQHSKF